MLINHKKELVNELYIYTVLTLLAGTFFGFFYGVFLYKNTYDFRILLIDMLVSSAAALLGYLIGSYSTHRKGYLNSIRLSLLLAGIAAFVAYFFAKEIVLIYIYISIIKGVAVGIYGSVFDIYLLKEMNQSTRGKYLYVNLAIEFLVTTLAPILVGAMLTFGGGYQTTFLIAGVLYFSGIFFPKQYNKKPKSTFSVTDAKRIINAPYFKEFGLNFALGSGADQLNIFLIAIIPYLILKNEFSVGVIAGLAALLASITSFFLKNVKEPQQHKLGYTGGIGRLLGNIFLAFFWNTPIMVIRGLFNNVFAVFYDPAFRKTQICNAEKILEKEINNQSLELIFIEAILAFVGKFIAALIFLVILTSVSDQGFVIRLLLPVYGLWKICDYSWNLSMKKRLSRKAIAV